MSIGPTRMLRDGMLRAGYRLDPSLSALQDEIQWIRDQAILELPEWSWHRLDRQYAGIRRSLLRQTLQGRPNWRQGPVYSLMVAHHAGSRLAMHGSLRGRTYMELGCGANNPFATAALMYLNGAESTISLDLMKLEEQRCAEALCELLAWSALCPTLAIWQGQDLSGYHERLAHFNVVALANGDLKSGLKNVPMTYRIADIHDEASIAASSVDLMTSRDVLEHFLDFPKAVRRIGELMAPGGLACHHIDVADHRIYDSLDPKKFSFAAAIRQGAEPPKYHSWSFLAEPEDHSDGLCNRLRASEFRRLFVENGFEVVGDEPEREPLPPSAREGFIPRYRNLDLDDLQTTRVTLTLRRSA